MNEHEKLVIIHTERENHKTKKITIDQLRDWIIVPRNTDIKKLFREYATNQFKTHKHKIFSNWLIKKKGIGRHRRERENIEFIDYDELLSEIRE